MLMRSRVQSWACPADHHWQLNWLACAVLDSPVWNCTCLCKLITQIKACICRMGEQTELGTNTYSLEAFLVWYVWQMSYSSVSFLLQMTWAVLSWKMLLSCCIISVSFILSQVLRFAYIWLVQFLFLLQIRLFFLIPPRTEDVYEHWRKSLWMRKPQSPVLIPVGSCCSSCNQKHRQFHSRVVWVFIRSSRNVSS